MRGQFARHDAIAEPPAGHGIGFGEPIHDDGVFLHIGQGCNGFDFQPIIYKARINLIGHHPAVEFLRFFCNVFQVCARDDPAGRVTGGIQDD